MTMLLKERKELRKIVKQFTIKENVLLYFALNAQISQCTFLP